MCIRDSHGRRPLGRGHHLLCRWAIRLSGEGRPRQRPDDDRTEYRDRGLRADRRSCDLVDGAADPEKEHRRRGLTLVILCLCRGWMLRDTQRRVADSTTSDTRTGSCDWPELLVYFVMSASSAILN